QADLSLQARQDSTRQHVEIAHGIVVWAHALEASGRMDRAQAQQLARSAIAALRYEGSEYFWINDMHPRVVMHPIKPELDGKDVSDLKDPNGLPLFKAFVAKVRESGKGFVAYQWPKPGSSAPVDKISYVQGFEPWGWVIGSGIYIGDLREATMRQLTMDAAIVAAALVLAGYLFLSFYRVMDGGLKETRRHLRAMTSGDLTTSPSPWGNDEAAQLMLELRAMQDSLRQMVMRVRRSSDEIVHSSSEIASGAMDLSARTEQAAANLEESAASMEEISSTVKSSSDNTTEAARVAGHNAELAGEGGRVMRDVVQTMDSIRESSARIADIIATIDGIAFQTNILALNAAVEAARAGEQGRGFAVVAGEVRTLAQRSAGAAREIRDLIGRSVEQVEAGTGTVHRAGSTMEEIVTASQRVSQLLAEVANGAREQSLGIAQIGAAVQELDRMTQQNAALVEQTAAASGAMKGQAESLATEVARFRLPEGTRLAEAVQEDRVDDFDFDQAIDAHRQWKVKLRKAIAEHSQLDAETICRDDRCPLGQWIHGAGGRRWGSRPTFTALLGKHAEFHAAAGAVARKINAGAYGDAERLIGSGSVFANVSNEVSTLLTRAKRGL
ncbi:MAG: methyl-accepting chemotaxis protein, partial [Piscinibacter sp.]|uniref:methyl-accepting chemotaxis protein n=1 Tax=Piscinibacter sp. TaxID=1903157 RepID=UPI003D0D37A9